ncbi:hypothetical protein [Rubrivirga sp. IMCC45206]|uniref:hypothetical protein n=1 Tax=Rubrivirga sp. IMCC45206 TaxID=3391614 RepID=UPI00398FD94A
MRLVLALLFAVALALPTAAQDRFAATCLASVAADAPAGLDGAALCGCAASGALAQGVAPADLDASVDILEERTQTASPAVEQAAVVATEALMACAVQSMTAGSTGGTASTGVTAEVVVGGQTITGAATLNITPAARPLPAGLSTGNGTGTAQGRQMGKGAPIRITNQ